jgi:hypothetical protein
VLLCAHHAGALSDPELHLQDAGQSQMGCKRNASAKAQFIMKLSKMTPTSCHACLYALAVAHVSHLHFAQVLPALAVVADEETGHHSMFWSTACMNVCLLSLQTPTAAHLCFF